LKYRAEIDGLRALAVVPVILFHAGFEFFSGGFVGVDVFFVISGYLITTILIEDLENKRFSIINFYERRARRILPALFVVMFISILPAYFVMLPDELQNLGQSIVATTLFANNVLLDISATDYWALQAEFKPLLHTWSLGIEEQYYLLFPLFLMLAWRFGKNRVFWMIVVMAVISLLLSEWGWRNNATTNFYLAPARAWELFAGSISAIIVQKRGVQKNNFLAFLGLATIIFSIFAYDESTPFPSVYALAPVLGVMLLVLFAEKETLVAKLLGTKVFVGIGLISYSAYLWHQPILAYLRTISIGELVWTSALMMVPITFFFAVLTWKFVEQPFRKVGTFGRNKFLSLMIILSTLFVSIGLILHQTEGFSEAFYGPSKYGSVNVWGNYNNRVYDDYGENNFDNSTRIKVLVVGSSYARDFINALTEAGISSEIDLSYRDNGVISHCDLANNNAGNYHVDRADVVIFGFSAVQKCSRAAFDNLKRKGKIAYYASYKGFGYNLQWIRLELLLNGELVRPYSKRRDDEILINSEIRKIFSESELIDIQQIFKGADDSLVRIVDSKNRLLSVDRIHLTQPGAQYLGSKLILNNHSLLEVLKEHD
jgi:peptidoglycan/LPS O-acetylase OafA/YrhL